MRQGAPLRRLLGIALLAALPPALAGAQGFDLKGVGTCTPGAEKLCFQGGRFAVEMEWEDPQGMTRKGKVVPFGSDSWGFFRFDDARYLELMVKVLDGCLENGFYWVQATALSDVRQTLTVTDTITGSISTYPNTFPGSFLNVSDTNAFPCTLPPSFGKRVGKIGADDTDGDSSVRRAAASRHRVGGIR